MPLDQALASVTVDPARTVTTTRTGAYGEQVTVTAPGGGSSTPLSASARKVHPPQAGVEHWTQWALVGWGILFALIVVPS